MAPILWDSDRPWWQPSPSSWWTVCLITQRHDRAASYHTVSWWAIIVTSLRWQFKLMHQDRLSSSPSTSWQPVMVHQLEPGKMTVCPDMSTWTRWRWWPVMMCQFEPGEDDSLSWHVNFTCLKMTCHDRLSGFGMLTGSRLWTNRGLYAACINIQNNPL